MTIETVTLETLHEVLPLIKQYQIFYGIEDRSLTENTVFFSQFATHKSENTQFLYRNSAREVIGFATVYFSFSSTSTCKIAILNDLFTVAPARGKGVGRALIEHARRYAGDCGAAKLQWSTALDNKVAQQLYDALPTKKTQWFVYSYPISNPR